MAITETLLATLTRGARLASPYIEGFIEKGLSIDKMQEALRPLGAAARRADIIKLVQAAQDRLDVGVQLRALRDDLTPDPSRLAKPITNTLRRFSFQVRIDGTDIETGEDRSELVTVSTSRLLTGRELKQAALSMAPNPAEGQQGSEVLSGLDVENAVILTGTDRGF